MGARPSRLLGKAPVQQAPRYRDPVAPPPGVVDHHPEQGGRRPGWDDEKSVLRFDKGPRMTPLPAVDPVEIGKKKHAWVKPLQSKASRNRIPSTGKSSTDFQVVSLSEMNLESQKLLWLAVFISMAIQTPLLPFHVWLPRAHAEAPLAGSVILAGLILKLATYGYMRILIQFLPDATSYFSPLVQTIAVITLIYASLATLRQTDLKALVAYSSIGHMAVVVLGLFSNTIQGIDGALLLSLAHGVVSPALFLLVGGVLYDRYHTRTIRYYRAVPLSANWAGEFLCLAGAFQRNPLFAVLGSTGIVLSAAYSIWLYNRIAFGAWSKYLTTDLSRREFMLLLPLLIVAVIFGIFPNIVLDTVHVAQQIHVLLDQCSNPGINDRNSILNANPNGSRNI
ncbi:hypothetical protein M5K25_028320 [Dendrobium thyrsiflorum]|uniref:NADH-ubiquinone oxidoreductase chain 4 n=1 Tax=Dendrobium thyrsiflorum TaxID=117978 RepID=A0ABD0TTI7_DENTH